jgi:hypothetical protein
MESQNRDAFGKRGSCMGYAARRERARTEERIPESQGNSESTTSEVQM